MPAPSWPQAWSSPGARGSSPMTGRWSGQYGRNPRYVRSSVHVREEREQPDRLRREPPDHRQATGPVEADAFPAGADEHRPAARPLDRRPTSRGPRPTRRRSRRTRRCRPCAARRGGSGSVTRMKPATRQDRQRRAGERRDLAGPRPGGVDHPRRADAGSSARRSARPSTSPPPSRRSPVTASRRGRRRPRRAPPQERRRREHRLDLGVLRVPRAARDVAGQVRLELREAGRVDRLDLTPAARCSAASSPSAPASPACRATTTPPLGSYSSASAPSSSRQLPPQRGRQQGERRARRRAPCRETRMLPSPGARRAARDRAAVDDGDPQPRRGQRMRARGADDPRADDDDVRGGADHGSIMSHYTDHSGPCARPRRSASMAAPSAPSTRAPARRSRTSPRAPPPTSMPPSARPSPRRVWPRSGSQVVRTSSRRWPTRSTRTATRSSTWPIARPHWAGRGSPASSTARSTSCGSSRA